MIEFDGTAGVISDPGVYFLTQDITWGAMDGAALTIACDNVTLDLNGHSIIGSEDSATSAVGISAIQHSGLTIYGGSIVGFMYGVHLEGTYDVTNNIVSAVDVSNSTFRGIAMEGTGDTVTNCNVSNIGGTTVFENNRAFGIENFGPSGQIDSDNISNVHGTSESVGISISDQGNGTLVSNCSVDGTGSTGGTFGLWVSEPGSVDLVSDRFSNWHDGAAFSSGTTGTIRDTAFQNVENSVVGNATDLGGNSWTSTSNTSTIAYDTQGRVATVSTHNADGSFVFTDYNAEHSNPWLYAVSTYDSQSALIFTTIKQGDGTQLVTTYDPHDAHGWKDAISGYDAAGQSTYVTVENLDRTSEYTVYDHNHGSYTIYHYDSAQNLISSQEGTLLL